jgi:hypothetical protein
LSGRETIFIRKNADKEITFNEMIDAEPCQGSDDLIIYLDKVLFKKQLPTSALAQNSKNI